MLLCSSYKKPECMCKETQCNSSIIQIWLESHVVECSVESFMHKAVEICELYFDSD